MTVQLKSNFDRESIMNYSKQHQEPDWLLNLRLRGLEQSEVLELPKPEKTNISKWNMLQFKQPAEEQLTAKAAHVPSELQGMIDEQEKGHLIIHKNGIPVYSSLSDDLQKKGIVFTDLKTAVQEHRDLLSEYMHQLVQVDEHKLTALHAALINCGIFLYVPQNVEVDIPLQSIFWQEDADCGLIPHVVIVAEANSKVTYVENTFGNEARKSVNHYVAEVFVGPGAKVHFAAIDQLGEQTTSFIYRRAVVQKDGHIDWALGQMNSGHTLSDNTTVLKGDGSTGDTKSVVIGQGDQSENFVQRMNHYGLHTDGQILSHAVMKDSARAIFNGISKIEKGSTKSNGEQTERVLMLSEKARGDANPILLIDEDDVTAGHAASVGQVDQNQLYYLMSRGIPRSEAEKLIILGFLSPVVEKIPLEGVKRRLIEVIERKVK